MLETALRQLLLFRLALQSELSFEVDSDSDFETEMVDPSFPSRWLIRELLPAAVQAVMVRTIRSQAQLISLLGVGEEGGEEGKSSSKHVHAL